MPPRPSTKPASRQARAARADETWQQLVPKRPGVEDLLEAKRIPTAAIDANPEQPRKGPPRGIEELAESILAYGLLQPIIVTPPYSGRYVCLAGHRRLAAYRYLAEQTRESRWATIPAIERDTHTDDRLVVALLENLSREDLSEAEIITGLRLLHDLRGWSQTEIARRIGVSKGWISKYFRVAEDPAVSQHVQAGALPASKAYEVVVAKSPDAKERALAAAVGGATLAAVRRIAAGKEFRHETPAGEEHRQEHSADRHEAPFGEEFRHETSRARTVATAPLDAGVRDLAALADQLGLTVELDQLQLFRLMRTLVAEQTTTISLGQFLRLVRADVRKAEALVRAHPRGG